MTPVGLCPECATGLLRPTGDAGYVRCPTCVFTFDHLGKGYDSQGRLLNRRDGV